MFYTCLLPLLPPTAIQGLHWVCFVCRVPLHLISIHLASCTDPSLHPKKVKQIHYHQGHCGASIEIILFPEDSSVCSWGKIAFLFSGSLRTENFHLCSLILQGPLDSVTETTLSKDSCPLVCSGEWLQDPCRYGQICTNSFVYSSCNPAIYFKPCLGYS